MCFISSDSSLLTGFRLFDFHVGVQFGDAAFLFGICLFDADVFLRFGFGNLRFFLCVGNRYLGNSVLVCIGNRYLLQFLGFCNGDILVFAGFCNLRFTFLDLSRDFDSTEFFLFFDISLCFVLGLALGFLTQVHDVVGSIADITDVDIHQIQTEFAEFRVDIVFYFRKEFIAVGVQFFDCHVGYDQTHLTVNDICNQILFVVHGQSQHTFGGVLHDFGIGADSNSDCSRNIYTDILCGKCACQFAVDLHRLH